MDSAKQANITQFGMPADIHEDLKREQSRIAFEENRDVTLKELLRKAYKFYNKDLKI